jgi:N-acetylmuramoyl-L-alanine amidase
MTIKLIVVHCAATPPDMDIGADEIRKWHTDKGWSDIGYHYVIRRSGDVETGRPESVKGAHTYGYNTNSLGVCMVGGVDAKGKPDSNFTANQYAALERTLHSLTAKYPSAEVAGHRDFDNGKACPSFDVNAFWSSM